MVSRLWLLSGECSFSLWYRARSSRLFQVACGQLAIANKGDVVGVGRVSFRVQAFGCLGYRGKEPAVPRGRRNRRTSVCPAVITLICRDSTEPSCMVPPGVMQGTLGTRWIGEAGE